MTTVAWSTLEPGLSAMFKRIATVPGSVPSVAGSKGPGTSQARSIREHQMPVPSNPVTLDWYIVSMAPVGRDELRETYDPDTIIEGDTYQPDPEDPEARLGAVIVSAHGHRGWAIEVRIESTNQSKPASDNFRALVDRMRLPSVNDELTALGLAYTSHDEVADDEYDDEEGRRVSVYIARLFFNASSYAADAPITTIESAVITTTVKPEWDDP